MRCTELCRRIRESAENRDFRLVRAPAMTEQSEPYHGEIVHTQEVRGSSPFAPTKKERHHIVVSLFFCGHYVTQPLETALPFHRVLRLHNLR